MRKFRAMQSGFPLDEAGEIPRGDKQGGDGDEVSAEGREVQQFGASVGLRDEVRRGEASLHGVSRRVKGEG